MKNVGKLCETLLAPAGLKTALAEIGTPERFSSQSVLFRAGGNNDGVFLIRAGRVDLEVPGIPELSRGFSSGSVLGLPSTFSERPYNLTAVSATETDVVHVDQKSFLDLMKNQSELCREATDILTRELAFIFSALRTQPKSPVGEPAIARSRRAINQ